MTYNLEEPTTIPSGVAGIDLVHMPEWFTDTKLPADGHWSVTLIKGNIAMQRCGIGFRSLHAAAHYAFRIRELADWEDDPQAVLKTDGGILSKAMRHAEAHAHEIDATWPAGSVVPFSNGPSIIDEGGSTHKFLAQAPSIEWDKDAEGHRICSVCGATAVVEWGFED